MNKKQIPLSVPNFEGNEQKYVEDAVCHGWVSTAGEYVSKLEEMLAVFLHTKKVVACQSGTAAIHLSLISADVRPGDMVIVPTLTFIAAVNPVRYQFADPIFMDCDDSLCMDPIKLEKFCRDECEIRPEGLFFQGRHVKAIVVVHVFGNMADMQAIMRIAKKYCLKVIEDATEALGTKYSEGPYKGRYAGTIGDYGAYSFNGNKIITTGGGGAVIARNIKEVDHLKYLSTQAKDDPHFYVHNEIGYNYRMTNVQAAIGVAQMEKLSEFIDRKRKNYVTYQEKFNKYKKATLMPFRAGTESNTWFYALLIYSQTAKRNLREIVNKLGECGIETRTIWGLIHKQKPYQNDVGYRIEKAEEYSKSIINLPCSTNITEREIDETVIQIKRVLDNMG